MSSPSPIMSKTHTLTEPGHSTCIWIPRVNWLPDQSLRLSTPAQILVRVRVGKRGTNKAEMSIGHHSASHQALTSPPPRSSPLEEWIYCCHRRSWRIFIKRNVKNLPHVVSILPNDAPRRLNLELPFLIGHYSRPKQCGPYRLLRTSLPYSCLLCQKATTPR